LLAPIQAAVLDRPIDDQVSALRWASRVVFALGVFFIVLAAGEVFAWRLFPVLTASAVVVLHPMFAYIGSGVNNDNGVMLFASAALWQLAQGWRRGYSLWRLLLIAGLIVLALQSKRTAAFLVLWAPLVLAVWWLRRQTPDLRRKALIATGATAAGMAALALLLYFVPGPTPANWRSASPWSTSWQATSPARGERTFRVQDAGGGARWLHTSFRRPIGVGDGLPIVVTAQHRGSEAALVLSDDVGNVVTTTLSASGQWQPAQVRMRLDQRATRVFVWLRTSSSQPALFDDLMATLASDPPQPLPLSNPSAEQALPMLGQIILSVAEPIGAYGQAARLIQDYRANIAALAERLPLAIAFVQQSFWGKFGIFANAPNPTLDMGWVTLLALGFGVALTLTVQAICANQPDPDGAALLALSLVGLGLLLAQTFAPLLSFAADRTWLPQGRYLFVGMGLLASVLSAAALRAPTEVPGIVIGVMALQLVGLHSQVSAFFTR
ncbi:MAG: hypothetical protein RMM31_11505, partial [Anaerolineae bacterium]|nr:hypothetical protein [Anaerolineae bacterium]